MPRGALCLFQRETRGNVGGECITGLDALRRAEGWFLGYYTGHWPPDTRDSELESHFPYAGDVLVSEAFYAPELSGAGEFFMVRDLRRILDAVWQDACPLIVTTITNRKNEVVSVIDARNDLERIYPWIDKDAWNPESIAVAFDSKKEELLAPVEKGWWWSLPEEPFPFVNGKGLLKALAAIASDENPWKLVCSALGTDLSVGSELFFGLRYPKRGGGVEWLVLWMSPSSKPTPSGGVLIRNDDAKRRTFEETQVACYHVHGARPSDFRLRNTGVVAPRIEGKTVALIGLGALGSRVAELLGQAGVGAIQLCDLDHLKIGNIARHIGGVRDFGACKTRVVAARLFDVNPYVEIPPVIEGSAVASLDRLAKYLRTANITVCTVADEQVESAINQIAVIEGKAVLYARALRRGAMGRVFLVRPGRDPCKACLGEYARVRTRGESATKDWIEVAESDDDAVIHECGRPVIPASAIDLSFIATLAARVALDVLEEVDGETNHWVWSRASALDVDPRLDHPFATVACCLPPWAACGICSEPDVSSLLIQDDVRSFIVNQVESSLSTETGGILIGFVGDGGQAVVLRATGPGPKAEKSATRFDRDVTFVQRELNMAARELGERGRYGWCHPIRPREAVSGTGV